MRGHAAVSTRAIRPGGGRAYRRMRARRLEQALPQLRARRLKPGRGACAGRAVASSVLAPPSSLPLIVAAASARSCWPPRSRPGPMAVPCHASVPSPHVCVPCAARPGRFDRETIQQKRGSACTPDTAVRSVNAETRGVARPDRPHAETRPDARGPPGCSARAGGRPPAGRTRRPTPHIGLCPEGPVGPGASALSLASPRATN